MRTSGGPGVSGIRHYATGCDGNCPTQARTRLEWATRQALHSVLNQSDDRGLPNRRTIIAVKNGGALMPPRPLPLVHSLQEACREVRDQPQGKPAIQFVSMTQDCTAPNPLLVQVCTNLIMSTQAVAAQEAEIVGGVRYLLTIEDFVRQQGQAWGFNPATIQRADANAQYYDIVAGLGHARYS